MISVDENIVLFLPAINFGIALNLTCSISFCRAVDLIYQPLPNIYSHQCEFKPTE